MYPFDINIIDGEPWWVVLHCNPNSDWSWTESHLLKFESQPELIELIECADIYYTYVKLGFDDRSKGRTPIRKINLKSLKQINKLTSTHNQTK